MSLITWYSNKMCKMPSSPNVNSAHSSTFSSLSATFKFSFSSCYHRKSSLRGQQRNSNKGAKLEEDINTIDDFRNEDGTTKTRTASHADTSATDEEEGNNPNNRNQHLAIVDPAAATSPASEYNSSSAVHVIEYAPARKKSSKSLLDRPKSAISLSTFDDPTSTALAQNLLESALGPDSKIRKTIIKRAEAILTGEIFCFYAAISKWEQLAKDYQVTHRHRRKVETDARRIVALFVAPNAPYENGCLSGQTKIRLLMMSNMAAATSSRSSTGNKPTKPSLGGSLTDPRLFSDAKDELRRDILGNPVLRKLVQEEIGYYRSLHHGATDFR